MGGQVPIIEGHPSDARLAMTAGYDGNIIVWDVVAGRKLMWYGQHPRAASLSARELVAWEASVA